MIDLVEVMRKELVNKSKNVDTVKSYGTTRYDRRIKQKELISSGLYNNLDMSSVFIANTLSFKVPIKGETNNYEVTVVFDNITDAIKREITLNHNVLDYKCVYRAIIKDVNNRNVYVSCTCPDFKFRFSYVATQGGYNAGRPETRPAKITNPNNSKGTSCKHILEVLTNLGWAINLSTAVYNYIEYMKKNYEDKYIKLIYPKIFDKPYEEVNEEDDS